MLKASVGNILRERRTGEEHVGICPQVRDSPGKPGLIPDSLFGVKIYCLGRSLRTIS
jgi:hypothetical protein